MDQLTPVPEGSGSFNVTLVAVPVPAAAELETVTVKPTLLPAVTGLASAVLVMERAGGAGRLTTMVAEALTFGALVALAVAVFLSVWLQVELVPLETCTMAEAPGAMFPKLQLSTWEPTEPLMAQVPGPA